MIKYLNKKMKVPDCKSGGVVFCADLHGHHKKMDLFMYSCLDTDPLNGREHNQIMRAAPDGVDRTVPVFNARQCKF